MKKMAILYFSDYRTWPAGGMLQYLRNILPELEKHFELTVYGCSVDGVMPRPIVLNKKIYPVVSLGNVKTKGKFVPNYFRYLYYTFKTAPEIEANRFDIIYIHAAPIFYAYCKRKMPSKTIYAYHQHGLSICNPFFSYFQSWAMQHADIVFVNCGKSEIREREQTLKIKVNTFIQAPGQVNVDLFKPDPAQKKNVPVLCYSGRMTEQKQPVLLLKTFAQIKKNKTFSKSQLILIGDGEQRTEIETIAEKLGVKEDLIITGFFKQSQIIPYLQQSSIFVMPSKGEGMSLSVLEAMACGLPVVCFDVPGMRELVLDEVNGVVATAQTKDALETAILRAWELKDELSANAIAYARQYSIETVAGKIIKGFESACFDRI